MARTAATLGEAAHITDYISLEAADWYVCDRVRGFLPRRHKVPPRGTRRFSDQYIYGNLGVLSLRSLRAKPV
jgi:hypothetical protein